MATLFTSGPLCLLQTMKVYNIVHQPRKAAKSDDPTNKICSVMCCRISKAISFTFDRGKQGERKMDFVFDRGKKRQNS